ncbi:MAG: hypothetical protein WC517_04970 [Patescibacteria group bacterium]
MISDLFKRQWVHRCPPRTAAVPQPPKGPSKEELEECAALEQQHAETMLQEKINFFKSMSSPVREEIIRNEELRYFYSTVGYIGYVPYGSRLDILQRKIHNGYSNYLHPHFSADFMKTLLPSIGIDLDLLKRAHLDACADDMIGKKL